MQHIKKMLNFNLITVEGVKTNACVFLIFFLGTSGCESVHETQYWTEGNTINIRITVTEEILYGAQAHCDLALDNFRVPVYIGQWDAIGAYDTYKINVNGVTEVFRIEISY